MRVSSCFVCCFFFCVVGAAGCHDPVVPADRGAGEGEGEGEGVVTGEGEGEGAGVVVAGEGEGEGVVAEGEGEGEDAGEGEGEGEGGAVVLDPCSVDGLYAERVGYGAHATGGDPDRVYVVDSLSGGAGRGTLRDALTDDEPWWIVFAVDGEIVLDPEKVEVTSHKTIDGRGRDVTINGALQMEDVEDIIVTDVHMKNDRHLEECGQAGDVVVLRGSCTGDPDDCPARDFWFHHVDFHHGGDGLLDVRGGTNVTVSWSHFHDHSKGMLMWKDTDNLHAAGMRVTLHHNFIDQLTVRGPRFHYGKLHMFNQYVYHWYDHGSGCMDEAECLSEGSIWEARDRCTLAAIFLEQCVDPAPCGDSDGGSPTTAWITDDGDSPGFTRSEGDLLLNGAVLDLRDSDRVSDPPYDYVVDDATVALADRIRAEAGPRPLRCQP